MKTAMFFAIAFLFAFPAHAGRLSGHVALRAPSDPQACDTLGAATRTPHRVHGRIMQGTVKAWEDSVSAMPGSTWELLYPELTPGTYQASSWTSKATNGMVGCPDILNFTVKSKYEIIFGWATIGALWSTEDQRVIGMAEMLRRLQACDSLRALRP